MRTNRLIRKRGRRRKIGVVEVDITSLLDILVILLVFLLKSYNSSGVLFNIPDGVRLPYSQSRSHNTTGTIVQVSPEKIWVDDKEILDVKSATGQIFDHRGRRIIPLYNELVRKKEVINQVEKVAQNAKKFSGRVNLIIDKTMKYTFIRKIMYTCAEAGYRQYKFVVRGEEM